MRNVRVHGIPPCEVAVLHGGPGAIGEVEPVARKLARDRGVLEPYGTATSLDGQVEELRNQLMRCGHPPMTLIGHSWGAHLAWILAGRHPGLVQRLVLVSSGAFRAEYAVGLLQRRRWRLSRVERSELDDILSRLEGDEASDACLARLGALMLRADSYDIRESDVHPRCDLSVYRGVWPEAEELRRNGRLLELGESISQPVIAVHGDYDPSPAEGVREPLSAVLADFQFILLKDCGHVPWLERRAAGEFYRVLREILAS